jgi:hypothetical protein
MSVVSAQSAKEKGNAAFRERQFLEAIKQYDVALADLKCESRTGDFCILTIQCLANKAIC